MSVFQPIDVRAPDRRRKQLAQRLMEQLGARGGLGAVAGEGRPIRALGDLRANARPGLTQSLHLSALLRNALGPGGMPRLTGGGPPIDFSLPARGTIPTGPHAPGPGPSRPIPGPPVAPPVGGGPTDITPINPPTGPLAPAPPPPSAGPVDTAPPTPIGEAPVPGNAFPGSSPNPQMIPIGGGLYIDPETLLVHGAPRGR